jgi:hypothetical protein
MSAAASCCGNTCTRAHDSSCSHARYDPLFTMSDNTRTIDTSTGANKCSHGRDVSADWWSQSGSNRRPHACKARALPAELWPLNLTGSRALAASERRLVGLGRFELPTSRLSSARSNQLSYKPGSDDRPKPRKRASQRLAHREIGTGSSMKKEKRRRRCPANGRHRFETMHPDVSKRSDRNA